MTLRVLIEELIGAWQVNDALRACAFFATDARYVESGRPAIVGREAIFAHFLRFFRDGPVWRFDVDDIIAQEDRAVVTYRFSIKVEAGGWQERDGCALVQCSEGLITQWREYHG